MFTATITEREKCIRYGESDYISNNTSTYGDLWLLGVEIIIKLKSAGSGDESIETYI